MQTGIYYWYGFLLPSRDCIKLIADANFDNVSFWWGDQFSKDYDEPKPNLPELARAAGLRVENVHAEYQSVNLLWEDKLESEDIIKNYISNIDDCYNLQIPVLIMHLTTGINPPMPNELGIDRIKRIIEHAEQKNIDIALENTRIIEHLDFTYSRINSDRLKFCYDSGHANCFTKSNDLLDKYGNKLIALHLHDNDGTADQHRIPGDGNINWFEFAQKLKQNNFHGSITLEIINEFCDKYKNLSAKQFLSEAYKKAKEISELF